MYASLTLLKPLNRLQQMIYLAKTIPFCRGMAWLPFQKKFIVLFDNLGAHTFNIACSCLTARTLTFKFISAKRLKTWTGWKMAQIWNFNWDVKWCKGWEVNIPKCKNLIEASRKISRKNFQDLASTNWSHSWNVSSKHFLYFLWFIES